MAKNDIETLEELTEQSMEYEELKSRLNRYAYKLESDYDFYKRIYMEHLNSDKSTIKQQLNYENARKQLDSFKYYFNKYITKSSENVDTEIKDDELPDYIGE